MTLTASRKRSILGLLVALNLGLPAVILITKIVRHQSAYHHPTASPIFSKVLPNWIDLISTEGTVVHKSDSLRLSFFAQFDSPVLPSSIALTSGTRDVLSEVKLSGGRAKTTSTQLLVEPEFEFYPGRLQFQLSYTNLKKEPLKNLRTIDLVFEDDFRSFQPSDKDNEIWSPSEGITLAREHGGTGILCEPVRIDKTSLLFTKEYVDNAQILVDFRPLTDTPNFSVSFNERAAFLIGDGSNNVVKFKHFQGRDRTYYERKWAIPSLSKGVAYQAFIRRQRDQFSIRILDAGNEIMHASLTDPVKDRPGVTHSYLAFWVFGNHLRSRFPVATEIMKVSIFFPPD
jgi:hypothetical protein